MKPPKFSLRVSGARIGSVARPVEDGAVAIAPARRLGLRVHASSLAMMAKPGAVASGDSSDYATLDDYEDTP